MARISLILGNAGHNAAPEARQIIAPPFKAG